MMMEVKTVKPKTGQAHCQINERIYVVMDFGGDTVRVRYADGLVGVVPRRSLKKINWVKRMVQR